MEESLNLKTQDLPASRSRVSQGWLALGTGAAVITLLFALWPYQSWQYGSRQSVLVGWVKVVQEGQKEWMFCLLVPIIVGGMIYLERDRLKGLALQGSWSGLPLLGLGAIFYWLGYKVDTGYFGYAAIQCILAGLVLLLGGREWMERLTFAWLFLMFSWPMFFLDQLLPGHLKIPTAAAAKKLLGWMGVATIRDGSQLQSAGDAVAGLAPGAKFRLEVSDSCSGMRSLYVLIMVSALYGHIALRRVLPKLVLFACAIPLAVLGNIVRLLLLAFGSLWFGQRFAIGAEFDGRLDESTYHIACGLAVFGVALAGMFGLASLLEGSKHWNRARRASQKGAAASTVPGGVPAQRYWPRCAVALALAGLAVAACQATTSKTSFAEPGMLLELPVTVKRYHGEPPVDPNQAQSSSASQDDPARARMNAKERRVFESGVRLDRLIYSNARGVQIQGTLVLSGDAKRSLHTPEVCLPDAGWIKISSDDQPLILADGREIGVNLLRFFRDVLPPGGGQPVRLKCLLMNWYIGSEGVSTPSYFESNFITYRDAIFRSLNHRWGQASFFIQYREPADAKDQALQDLAAMGELQDFVSEAAPKFLLPAK